MKKIILILLFAVNVAVFGQSSNWSLQDCIDYAIQNNITIKKTEINKKTSELNLQQSKYNKLPSVTGNTSLSLLNGSSVDPVTSTFNSQLTTSNSFNVSSSLTLYQGNQLNLNIEKNKILVDQNDLYLKEASNNITLSIIEAYMQTLYIYEAIEVAKITSKSTQQELKQAQIKYKNGAIAKLDLATIETQKAENDYQIVAAESQYKQQLVTLKQLLELPPNSDFSIDTSVDAQEIGLLADKMTVYENAKENLPTLKIYDLATESAKKDLEIEKANALPTVTLSAGLGTGYTSNLDLNYIKQITGNTSQSISVGVSIPIFSKHQNKTNVELAKYSIQQTELDKKQAEKDLYAKIETAYTQMTNNESAAKAAKIARDNAKLAYDMASQKYQFGALTNTELQVSRNTYLNSEQNYLQKKYLTLLYQQLLNFYQGNNSNSQI